MHVRDAAVFRYRLPLRSSLRFRGQTLSHREGLLLRLSDGPRAVWGEAAPLPGFSTETFEEAASTLGRVAGLLAKDEIESVRGDIENVPPSVAFAVESALAQWHALEAGLPLHQALEPYARDAVALSALLLPEQVTQEAVARFRSDGYGVVKLKVGSRAPREDAERVRQTRVWLGDGAELRLDANRAWSYDEACAFADALGDSRPAYIEEPLRDATQLPQWCAQTGISFAVDESLQEFCNKPEEQLQKALEGASAFVWKPTITHASRALAAYEAHGPKAQLIISGAYESGVGTIVLANYAAAFSQAAAGLDTYRALAHDVLKRPLSLRPTIAIAAWTKRLRVNTAMMDPVPIQNRDR